MGTEISRQNQKAELLRQLRQTWQISVFDVHRFAFEGRDRISEVFSGNGRLDLTRSNRQIQVDLEQIAFGNECHNREAVTALWVDSSASTIQQIKPILTVAYKKRDGYSINHSLRRFTGLAARFQESSEFLRR
jgi:hypothetical protein